MISGCQCSQGKRRRRDVYSMYDCDKRNPKKQPGVKVGLYTCKCPPQANNLIFVIKFRHEPQQALAIRQVLVSPAACAGERSSVHMRVVEKNQKRVTPKVLAKCSWTAPAKEMCPLRIE